MSKKKISRRRFVGDVAGGIAFTIVPPHVLGARGRNRLAPSDKLNIACIAIKKERASMPSPSRRPIISTPSPA